ncbi:hypothetical protein DFH09DRAFT_1099085 [Mycena vulgaris]|nr:hypothetical protein DFH09DRAFT_1099085 [Mycena vulgaris]
MDMDSFDGEKIQKVGSCFLQMETVTESIQENIAPSSEPSPEKKLTPGPKLKVKSATITSPKKSFCKQTFPTTVHPSTDGPSAARCRELTRDICLAIKQELECIKKIEISSLLPELHALQDDSHFLEESPVWNKFLELIGYQVFAFCRSPAKFKAANLGCGYFGPKGYDTIRNVLDAIGHDDKDDEIDHELFDTISPLVNKPQQWDEFDETSNLKDTEEGTGN